MFAVASEMLEKTVSIPLERRGNIWKHPFWISKYFMEYFCMELEHHETVCTITDSSARAVAFKQ